MIQNVKHNSPAFQGQITEKGLFKKEKPFKTTASAEDTARIDHLIDNINTHPKWIFVDSKKTSGDNYVLTDYSPLDKPTTIHLKSSELDIYDNTPLLKSYKWNIKAGSDVDKDLFNKLLGVIKNFTGE